MINRWYFFIKNDRFKPLLISFQWKDIFIPNKFIFGTQISYPILCRQMIYQKRHYHLPLGGSSWSRRLMRNLGSGGPCLNSALGNNQYQVFLDMALDWRYGLNTSYSRSWNAPICSISLQESMKINTNDIILANNLDLSLPKWAKQ